jgi:hypothetical protein
VTRRYPLELLQRARAAKVDATSRALSVAQRRVTSAEGEVDRRMRAKMDFEGELSRTRDAERKSLERGALKVADLERAAGWQAGADAERTSRARAVDDAKGALARAQDEAEAKRRTLAFSQRDHEIVEKHHQRWQDALQKEQTGKEDENAEEAHLSRWRGKADR